MHLSAPKHASLKTALKRLVCVLCAFTLALSMFSLNTAVAAETENTPQSGSELLAIGDGQGDKTLSPFADGAITLGHLTLAKVDGSEPELDADYTYNDTTYVLTIIGSAGYIIGMSETAPADPNDSAKKLTTTHSIVIAASVTVTLDSVRIDRSGDVNSAAFAINADQTANVLLKGSTFLKSGAKRSGLEVGANATVVIDNHDNATPGELTAQSSAVLEGDFDAPEHYESNGAGIGGKDSPTIVIKGGIINAYSTTSGSGRGAGIGGSRDGLNPQVIINGGVITAMSCKDDGLGDPQTQPWDGHGAGIGTGHQGTVSSDGPTTVTITGGDVTAYSTTSKKTGEGAGIGAGHYSTGVKVVISGGTVKAFSTEEGAVANGAGIGGSAHDLSGSSDVDVVVTISGGDVTAYASEKRDATGAGIGSGINGGATVNITGGTINACSSGVGPGVGAGIGSGSSNGAGSTSSVNISGGIITAYSSQKGAGEGAGIGNGSAGTSTSTVIITGGSILAKKTEGGDVSVSNPTDGAGSSVFLTTLTLTDAVGNHVAGAPVNSSIFPVAGVEGSYGLKDVFSDSSGKLYFWLPVGTYASNTSVIGAGNPTVSYPGMVIVGANNDNSMTLLGLAPAPTPTEPSSVKTIPSTGDLPTFFIVISSLILAGALLLVASRVISKRTPIFTSAGSQVSNHRKPR